MANLETIELKSNPQVKRIVLAAFPAYKKHKAFTSTFRELNINSYWDGGSKSTYVLVHVPTLEHRTLTAGHPFYEVAGVGIRGDNGMLAVDRVGNVIVRTLPQDFVIVEAGYFCGKPSTAHVHYPPKPELPSADVAQIEGAL